MNQQMVRAKAVWSLDWVDALLFVGSLALLVAGARSVDVAWRTRELLAFALVLDLLLFTERRRWFRRERGNVTRGLGSTALVMAGTAAAVIAALCLLLPHKDFAAVVGTRNALGLTALALAAIAAGSLLERRA